MQQAFTIAGSSVLSILPPPKSVSKPSLNGPDDQKSPKKLAREKSTMHTSDRTKPELPPSATKTSNIVYKPLMSSPLREELLNDELNRLKQRLEAHEKNRSLLISFASGILVTVTAIGIYSHVISRLK